MAKTSELREHSTDELHRLLRERKQELLNLRFQRVSHQLDNVMRLRQAKKEIAQLLTLVTEREKGIR